MRILGIIELGRLIKVREDAAGKDKADSKKIGLWSLVLTVVSIFVSIIIASWQRSRYLYSQ